MNEILFSIFTKNWSCSRILQIKQMPFDITLVRFDTSDLSEVSVFLSPFSVTQYFDTLHSNTFEI
jgi:hypothetical protein